MHTPHRAIGAALCCALASCIVPVAADGAFIVEGSVTPRPSSQDCELQLLDGSGGAKPLSTRAVTGAFRETFVVAPYPAAYRIRTICNGQVVHLVHVRYGTEVTYATPVVLPPTATR
jgi:hypothetical protein